MEIDVSIPPGPGPRRSALTRAADALRDLSRWHWFAIGGVVAVGIACGLVVLSAPGGIEEGAVPSAARAEPSPDRDQQASPSSSPEPSPSGPERSGTQRVESSARQAQAPKPKASPSSKPTERDSTPKDPDPPKSSPTPQWPSEEDLERLREYYEEYEGSR